jgi:hypothetical protein
MKRKKLTKAEREEMDARHARVVENVERTRKLAERAQAKLDLDYRPPKDRRYSRRRMLENTRRTRELAERAQAKLDAQRSSEP